MKRRTGKAKGREERIEDGDKDAFEKKVEEEEEEN